MKTVKICYPVHPWYCPKCKTLYFDEVECKCDIKKTNKCPYSVIGQCTGNFSPFDCDGIDIPSECSDLLIKDLDIIGIENIHGK